MICKSFLWISHGAVHVIFALSQVLHASVTKPLRRLHDALALHTCSSSVSPNSDGDNLKDIAQICYVIFTNTYIHSCTCLICH